MPELIILLFVLALLALPVWLVWMFIKSAVAAGTRDGRKDKD